MISWCFSNAMIILSHWKTRKHTQPVKSKPPQREVRRHCLKNAAGQAACLGQFCYKPWRQLWSKGQPFLEQIQQHLLAQRAVLIRKQHFWIWKTKRAVSVLLWVEYLKRPLFSSLSFLFPTYTTCIPVSTVFFHLPVYSFLLQVLCPVFLLVCFSCDWHV